MKFRWLLADRILHASVCFRLRATYNLRSSRIRRSATNASVGTALDCSLGLLTLDTSNTMLAIVILLPCRVRSARRLFLGTDLHRCNRGVRLPNDLVIAWITPCGATDNQSAFRRIATVYSAIPLCNPDRI